MLELDTFARTLTLRHLDEEDSAVQRPAAVTVDIKNAFPALARPAIGHAASVAGLPHAVRPLIKPTQMHCEVSLPGDPSRTRAFVAERGVTQGCPLSAILFIVSAESMLCCLEQTVTTLELPLSCADDLAVLLTQLEGLRSLCGPFKAWARASAPVVAHQNDGDSVVPRRPAGTESRAHTSVHQRIG